MKSNINLLNFTSLDTDSLKMILSWRNDPFVKEWMFTTEDITLEDHFQFITSLKANRLKQYFLVQQNEQYIGVIDFCNITQDSVTMGVYKNPKAYRVGKVLLEAIKSYAFKSLNVNTIYSEVFEQNLKALELYKSFGFKAYSNKIINKESVICMELKNENR